MGSRRSPAVPAAPAVCLGGWRHTVVTACVAAMERHFGIRLQHPHHHLSTAQ